MNEASGDDTGSSRVLPEKPAVAGPVRAAFLSDRIVRRVLVGVILVRLTGWLVVDPIVALLVATNIVWTAAKLLMETGHGLLDAGIGAEDRQKVDAVLEEYRDRGVMIHAVRTRVAGRRRFLEMHVLVPGIWTVQKGHDLCEEIEAAVGAAIPYATVATHLEPFDDPISWNNQSLDDRETP